MNIRKVSDVSEAAGSALSEATSTKSVVMQPARGAGERSVENPSTGSGQA